MNVIWTRRATNDLARIYSYIAQDNLPAAERIARTVLETVERLRRFPASGRPGRLPATRELVVTGTPYFLPYTVHDDRIVILSVLHAARRWP